MENHTLFDRKSHQKKLEHYLELHTQDLIDNDLDAAGRGKIWYTIAKTVKKSVINTAMKNTKNKNSVKDKEIPSQSQAARMLGINRATLRSYSQHSGATAHKKG